MKFEINGASDALCFVKIMLCDVKYVIVVTAL